MKRITIKMLEARVNQMELEFLQLTSLTQRIFSTEQRLNQLDQLLKGGVKGYESLLFRVTFLERLVEVKKHIKPITKKQMKEIRRLLREERSR